MKNEGDNPNEPKNCTSHNTPFYTDLIVLQSTDPIKYKRMSNQVMKCNCIKGSSGKRVCVCFVHDSFGSGTWRLSISFWTPGLRSFDLNFDAAMAVLISGIKYMSIFVLSGFTIHVPSSHPPVLLSASTTHK